MYYSIPWKAVEFVICHEQCARVSKSASIWIFSRFGIDGGVLSMRMHSILDWFLRPVSRKPRKRFGPVKPFLVHLYLKTEQCIRMKLLVWREPLFILRICKWNSSVIERFEILPWLSGCENFSGPSRNGSLDSLILVPRGRTPFGQHQESRPLGPLGRFNTESPRFTDFPSLCACSQSWSKFLITIFPRTNFFSLTMQTPQNTLLSLIYLFIYYYYFYFIGMVTTYKDTLNKKKKKKRKLTLLTMIELQ